MIVVDNGPKPQTLTIGEVLFQGSQKEEEEESKFLLRHLRGLQVSQPSSTFTGMKNSEFLIAGLAKMRPSAT